MLAAIDKALLWPLIAPAYSNMHINSVIEEGLRNAKDALEHGNSASVKPIIDLIRNQLKSHNLSRFDMGRHTHGVYGVFDAILAGKPEEISSEPKGHWKDFAYRMRAKENEEKHAPTLFERLVPKLDDMTPASLPATPQPSAEAAAPDISSSCIIN